MKHKQWIDAVQRIRGSVETRHDKIRLDKNERLSHFQEEFWQKIIGKIRQEHILAYPEVEYLYHKLAAFLGINANNIVITAGSDFAIKVAFELFVNPGDEVVVLDPTFAMVNVYCELHNCRTIKIGYDEHLRHDNEKLLGSLNENISLVIIANPNSPTGSYINNAALKIILARTAELSIPVLIDEAYHGFCPYTAFELLEQYKNLIITRTFSKTAGLAGLRIGYMIASSHVAELLYKFRPMYEVNSLAVLFASELLDNWGIVEDYIKATAEGKTYLLKELGRISFQTIDTHTNFIHADFGILKARILEGFEKDSILVRGSLGVKGLENYTRISVGNVEEMSKVIGSINRRLAELCL